MKRRMILGLFGWLILLGETVSAQAVTEAEYIEFIKVRDADGTVRCEQITRTPAEVAQMRATAAGVPLTVLPSTVGRRDNRIGLDIILRATPQLEANATAVAAFEAAAERWESIVKSPVTMILDVDYGPLRFGTPYAANVLGSTSTPRFQLTTTTIRQYADSLKSRNPGLANIYDAIPDPMPNTANVALPRPSGGLSNLQAIGFSDPNPDPDPSVNPFGTVAAIGFNSAFTYDFDPSNGITAGQTDFDAVVVHEIGHALGFISVIGGNSGFPLTWDLYRVRPNVVTNLATFNTAPRVLTPGPSATGGDHVYWDGYREYELSTATGGRTGGDGQQSSHWRADENRPATLGIERTIGIMDPTISAGVRDTIRLPDKRAMALMGWQIEFGNLIAPATELSAFSDYTTPSSVRIKWRNPNSFYDGRPLANWKVVVQRNGATVAQLTTSVAGDTASFTDTGLTEYSQNTYRIVGVFTGSGASDTGVVTILPPAFAGGAPQPQAGAVVSARSNGSTAVLSFRAPTKRADGTVLNNLSKARIFRINTLPTSVIDSVTLAPSDTGKTFVYIDTPPRKALPQYAYSVAFTSTAPANNQSATVTFPTVSAGTFSTAPYTETFEVNRQSVISDGLWDSTNVAANAGTFSLGARSYPNSSTFSAYIPQVTGSGDPSLSFFTVCRVDAADSAVVEVSRNRGINWTPVLSLNKNTHPEWTAGQNTWFQKNIPLAAFATDTILVRFRLKSDAATNDFGWLIDDISLSPGSLSSEAESPVNPTRFSLSQSYPNPFNPQTVIEYALPQRASVSLKVYDALGREVAALVSSTQAAGRYAVRFDGKNLSSGTYFYKIVAGDFSETKKMILIK